MHESNMFPLFMAWSIAAVLRIALGSATVAAITAGWYRAPLIATTGVSPELMVIAVWLRQRYLPLRYDTGLLAV